EVADGLEVRVDRGEPLGNRAGQASDGLHPAGGRDQGLMYRPEVEDHPEQAYRGDRDDQQGGDQGEPGYCWHGRYSFPCQPRSLATEPAYRTAPTLTSSMVFSVSARPSGTPSTLPIQR